MTLCDWQARFFAERVQTPASGVEGVYYREQVFGALEVLGRALPDLEEALGEENFRFFVRELMMETQPSEAMGTSLIVPFLHFLRARSELAEAEPLHALLELRLDAFATE